VGGSVHPLAAHAPRCADLLRGNRAAGFTLRRGKRGGRPGTPAFALSRCWTRKHWVPTRGRALDGDSRLHGLPLRHARVADLRAGKNLAPGLGLQRVAWRQPPIGGLRPLVGQRGAVPTQHLSRAPAEQAHGLPFVAAGGKPIVRGRVAQLMRVQDSDARLAAAVAQRLGNS
jgi:hypothetical protein